MKSILSFFSAVLISFTLNAQINFNEATSLLANPTAYSGVGLGVADMNNDGRDDIIRFNQGHYLEIEYQGSNGNFTRTQHGSLIDPSAQGSRVWSIAIGDVDHNGFNDIITGAAYFNPVLAMANANGTMFNKEELDGPIIYMQSANFADIDNDGLIDYYACHDEGVSSPYRNTGTGLVYDLDFMDTNATDPNQSSGNYASVFTDYDNDGDLDMYLSKCRLGVTDPNDGRRINKMFQNDGNGNFTDVAESIGLRPLGQTWSTVFGDIDNDGDFDAFMINHDIGSFLYENDGAGNFTEITSAAGIQTTLSDFPLGLQVFFEDFDNDGFIDLFLTTYNTAAGSNSEPFLYHNNGDKTFTKVTNPFGNNLIRSAAIGDLNSDGFIDVLAAFANGLNIPNSSRPDKAFLNVANNNNWLTVKLKGTTSNTNGIGARVVIHNEAGMQTREIKSGQSFCITNSLNAHFGIGQEGTVDSLMVYWPSGKKTSIISPAINQLHILSESIIIDDPSIEICEGEIATIYGMEQTVAGIYSDTITGGTNDTILQTLLIVNPSVVNTLPTSYVCDDSTITPGVFTEALIGSNGCDSIVITTIELFDPYITTIDIMDPGFNTLGSVLIDITNTVAPYTLHLTGNGVDTTFMTNDNLDILIPDLDAGDYVLEIEDGNGCIQEYNLTLTTSSINDLYKERIKIFPNPSTAYFTIDSPTINISKVFAVDMLGRRIDLPIKLTASHRGKIDLSNQSEGTYTLLIYNETGQLVRVEKIVKTN